VNGSRPLSSFASSDFVGRLVGSVGMFLCMFCEENLVRFASIHNRYAYAFQCCKEK